MPSSPRPPPARSTSCVLLGADPVRDCPDADLGRLGVEGAAVVVALDTFLTDSAALADVVLPAAAFGEKAGSTTNLEGRVTEVAQRVTPVGTARADWMVAAELADRLGLRRPRRRADRRRRRHRRHRRRRVRLPQRDRGRPARQHRGCARRGARRYRWRRGARRFRRHRPQQLRLSTRGEPHAVRPRRRHRQRAVARPAGAGRRRLRQPGRCRQDRRPARQSGAPRRRQGHRRASRSRPARAVPRGIVLVPFNHTGSDAPPTSIVDVAAGATDVRIEAG